MDDVLSRLHRSDGSPLEYVEDDVFMARMEEAKGDPQKARILSSIVAYNSADGSQMVENPASTDYTMQVLHRLGFRWDQTSAAYVDMVFEMLDMFRFFEA